MLFLVLSASEPTKVPLFQKCDKPARFNCTHFYLYQGEPILIDVCLEVAKMLIG